VQELALREITDKVGLILVNNVKKELISLILDKQLVRIVHVAHILILEVIHRAKIVLLEEDARLELMKNVLRELYQGRILANVMMWVAVIGLLRVHSIELDVEVAIMHQIQKMLVVLYVH